MKGMIFTEFLDMVETEFGLETTEDMLDGCELETDGAYTAVGNYDASELVALVVKLSELTDTPIPQLLHAFGSRIFGHFVANYGHFISEAGDTFSLLRNIEDHIHVEVRKLYPDAELPHFNYPVENEGTLTMEYRSERPLAHFAHGLMLATVAHFGEDIEIAMEDQSDGQGTHALFHLSKSTG